MNNENRVDSHSGHKSLRISIFGSSLPKERETLYDDAYKLGLLLGGAGYQVLTGGYIGVMEAVSKGTADAGGHVIGITCDEIEVWRPVSPNRWIMEERRYSTLRDRLTALIQFCDAAIAFPGGIGTLAEVAEMWSQLQVGVIRNRPLILVGIGWKNILSEIYNHFGEYIAFSDRKHLLYAENVKQAFETIRSIFPNE